MENNKPLISVIVPIYNVEKYLHKCIDSLLAQTYTNLEIILVDDGSPDSCGIICDEYAEKDSRIKAIHQENKGVANARNIGLNNASGDYIGWVDPDDYIDPVMYEILYSTLELTKSDISICSVHCFGLIDTSIIYENIVLNKMNYLKLLLSDKIKSFMCNKLYTASCFEGLSFVEGKTYEDVMIQHLIAEKVNSIALTDKILYYYRQWDKQITRKQLSSRTIECINAVRVRSDYYRNTEFYKYSVYSEFMTLKNYFCETIYVKSRNSKGFLKMMRKDYLTCFKIFTWQERFKYSFLCINPTLYNKTKIKIKH